MSRLSFFFLLLVFQSISYGQTVLEGKIGTSSVTFLLQPSNEQENGSYFYHQHLFSIPFHWSKKGNSFTLKTIPRNENEKSETILMTNKGKNYSGTWTKQGKKLKVSFVEKSVEQLTQHRFRNNPFFSTEQISLEEQLKLQHFKLLGLDSTLSIGKATISYFRETHTKLVHFRIDTGLEPTPLKQANQFLEWQQVQEFLNYFSCYSDNTFGNDFDYEVHYSDIFISPHLISYVNNHYNYCGGAHPSYYMSSTIFDVDQGKLIDNDQIVNDFGKAAVTSGEVDEYDEPITNFQSTVFTFLKETYPEEMTLLDEELWKEENQDYCQYGRIGIWNESNALAVTAEGLYVIVNFEHFRNDCTGASWAIVPFKKLTSVLQPNFLAKIQ